MKSILEDRHFLYLFSFLALLSYGPVTFNMILFDDDWALLQHPDAQMNWVVTLGRWGDRIIWQFLDNIFFVPVFGMAIMLACIYFSGKLLSEIMGFQSKTPMYIFILVFAFSPILIEATTLKMANITIGLGILFAFLASHYVAKNINSELNITRLIFNTLLSGLFLSLTVSVYQPLAFIVVQVIFILIIKNIILKDIELKEYFKAIYYLFFACVIGIIFYIIEVKLSLFFYDLDIKKNGGYSVTSIHNSLESWLTGLRLGWNHLLHLLFKAQHLYPLITKLLFLISIVSVVFYAAHSLIQKTNIQKTFLIIGFVIILLIIILYTPFAIGSISNSPGQAFRYNAILSIASIYGLIFALILEITTNKKIQKIFLYSATTLLLVFIFQHNKASTIRLMHNFKDFSQANRMLDRIESHPHFEIMERRGWYDLVIVGGRVKHTSQGRVFKERTKGLMGSSIVNCGVMNCQFRRIPHLFNLLGASDKIRIRYYFNGRNIPKYNVFLNNHIKNNQAWPAISSLIPFKSGFILIIDDRDMKLK